jgi:hypothetical protein
MDLNREGSDMEIDSAEEKVKLELKKKRHNVLKCVRLNIVGELASVVEATSQHQNLMLLYLILKRSPEDTPS